MGFSWNQTVQTWHCPLKISTIMHKSHNAWVLGRNECYALWQFLLYDNLATICVRLWSAALDRCIYFNINILLYRQYLSSAATSSCSRVWRLVVAAYTRALLGWHYAMLSHWPPQPSLHPGPSLYSPPSAVLCWFCQSQPVKPSKCQASWDQQWADLGRQHGHIPQASTQRTQHQRWRACHRRRSDND